MSRCVLFGVDAAQQVGQGRRAEPLDARDGHLRGLDRERRAQLAKEKRALGS